MIQKTISSPVLTEVPDGSKPVQLGSGLVTGILGQGGMANVYEIWNSELEIHKAVKLMHPSSGKDSIERFHTEVKICAKLNHPNIVEIHSVGKWNGLPYIEMERVDGITLESLIKNRGPLPAAVVVAAGILACNGLSYAHRHEYQLYGVNYHGIVHRDLKPANVMVCSNGQLKLMDFGIARPLDASFHTMDGNVVGTLQYLSPEQLEGGALDVRTDIYSLGETLYEALSGYQAFSQQSVPLLMSNKLKNKYKPLSEYHTNAPVQLIRLIHKAMARDRESRIPSAGAFATALKALAEKMGIDDPQEVIRRYMESSGKKRPNLSLRRKSHFKIIILSALLMITLVSSILLLLLSRNKQSESVALPTNASIKTISTPSLPPVIQPPQILQKDTTALNITPAKSQPVENKNPIKINKKPLQEKRINHPEATPEPPVKKVTALEQLQSETGLADPQALIPALYSQGRYKDVLTVFENIPLEKKRIPKIAVLALRSQISLKNKTALESFLSKYFIEDSEFFISKAQLALSRKDIAGINTLIASAESSPRVLLTYDELKREISYLKAMQATSQFDINPNETTYKEALDKWRDVRAALASNTSHEYAVKEREERKRMSQIYASVKDQQ